jgi:L-ascorbate metabolism protein UlaG (beta-lactamase superfamily)
MKIIHELYRPDVAMLPVGDVFTMGPREATYACGLLKPKMVIPMHFGTFPLLTGTPQDLEKRIKDLAVELKTMKPGETIA